MKHSIILKSCIGITLCLATFSNYSADVRREHERTLALDRQTDEINKILHRGNNSQADLEILLHMAAMNGNVKAIQLLLDAGARPHPSIVNNLQSISQLQRGGLSQEHKKDFETIISMIENTLLNIANEQ